MEADPGLGLAEAIDMGGMLGAGGVPSETLAIIEQDSLSGHLLIISLPGAPIIGRTFNPGVVLPRWMICTLSTGRP